MYLLTSKVNWSCKLSLQTEGKADKYSEPPKYWDSDSFVVVLSLYSSTLDLKWYNDYEVKVQTVKLQLFLYIIPHFRGPKVLEKCAFVY